MEKEEGREENIKDNGVFPKRDVGLRSVQMTKVAL